MARHEGIGTGTLEEASSGEVSQGTIWAGLGVKEGKRAFQGRAQKGQCNRAAPKCQWTNDTWEPCHHSLVRSGMGPLASGSCPAGLPGYLVRRGDWRLAQAAAPRPWWVSLAACCSRCGTRKMGGGAGTTVPSLPGVGGSYQSGHGHRTSSPVAHSLCPLSCFRPCPGSPFLKAQEPSDHLSKRFPA